MMYVIDVKADLIDDGKPEYVSGGFVSFCKDIGVDSLQKRFQKMIPAEADQLLSGLFA